MLTVAEIGRMQGAAAVDSRGRPTGRVGQSYVSSDGLQPLLVILHTGLLGTRQTVVPLTGATIEQGVLHLHYEGELIDAAPEIACGDELTDDEQGTIFDYYDSRAGGSASGTDCTPSALGAP